MSIHHWSHCHWCGSLWLTHLTFRNLFKVISFFIITLFDRLYVRVGILLTCGKHVHDRIISQRGEVWVHKSKCLCHAKSDRSSPVIEVSMSCQEWSVVTCYWSVYVMPRVIGRHLLLKCLCHARRVIGHVSIFLSSSTIFLLYSVLTMCYFFNLILSVMASTT
jgi:hypothetical protein